MKTLLAAPALLILASGFAFAEEPAPPSPQTSISTETGGSSGGTTNTTPTVQDVEAETRMRCQKMIMWGKTPMTREIQDQCRQVFLKQPGLEGPPASPVPGSEPPLPESSAPATPPSETNPWSEEPPAVAP